MADPDDRQAEEGGYVAQVMSVLATGLERAALHWRGRDVTAGEFTDSVNGVTRKLRGLGVGAGSVVGILVAPNSPEMFYVRYAAHGLGAAVCYLRSTNPGSSAEVLPLEAQLTILLDTSADVLYADDENAVRAKELAGLAPGGFELAGFDDRGSEEVEEPAEFGVWDPQALAVIAFTSGSTGRPKGIRQSGRIWDSIVRTTMTAITEPDHARMLVTTPLSHTVGPMADAVLASGGTVFLHEEFDPAETLRAIEEHRITRTLVATPHLYQLLDHDSIATTRLSSLRQLIYTGCAAAPARIAEAVNVFGFALVQGYGTTEGGRVTLLDPGDHQDARLLSTVGRPFPEVELKVCDPDSGQELAVGGTGEVWLRSPHVMDGYWADPELTAQVLRDGWYRTGDIGCLDEKGYLRLLDRIADVVKTQGVKVYPAVVEREILALPGVGQAAVYGVRDADNIERLNAAIVARPGARISPDDIRSRVAAALSAQHAPEVILLLDELPLNDSGKPDKRRLRSLGSAAA
ncbi:fatty acid--CoA ligase family protein [Streptomyces sp. NBC_00243]|uniref:class I adenylate-forming enzyme family protein n=1 Tax=Streptomyces sp. NBC_00243 TaxID=2975688 RepID=UPI002DD7C40D|nr:fatty acid--CoA ligase family protein [Streptomyces sp. NBC_00243]WRZ24471.1 fatty acid--CoA ligase family protein [Streptomyces sp. NBC_00243]